MTIPITDKPEITDWPQQDEEVQVQVYWYGNSEQTNKQKEGLLTHIWRHRKTTENEFSWSENHLEWMHLKFKRDTEIQFLDLT